MPGSANRNRHQAHAQFDLALYAPHTIAAIVEELRAQGAPIDAVLSGTALTEAQLGLHTTRTSYRELDTVARNALRLSSDPTTALRAGQRMHITSYGMFGLALMSSATREDAGKFAEEFVGVIGPFCNFVISDDALQPRCVLEPLYWPDASDPLHRFAVEFALSAHFHVSREDVDSSHTFKNVFVDYASPPHAKSYAALFRCPIAFNQRDCGFETAVTEGPIAVADARTHAMAREVCAKMLQEIAPAAAGVAADIRRLLLEQPSRFPTLEDVAEKLAMHPRALRRRLSAEGISYRELLAELRMRLASEYLRKTRMTNEQLAAQLGYSDAANFRHAFIRWTGKSPAAFRRSATE